ncbi:MAG: hypothetical protein H7Z71_07390 [Moraxellaceae bacterium]|nr:hypothetical protein [Pseudobdellovibrionaceae bacterium]
MFLFIPLSTFASAGSSHGQTNLIAIGQGISSPTLTSTVNFSTGYTHESPVGVVYQNSWRLSAEYDQDNNADSNNNNGKTGYGAELGYGTGAAGIAAGYYTRNCTGCEGRWAGSAAAVVADIGVGLRYQKDSYTAAALFNPNGTHRVGLIAEFSSDDDNDETNNNNGIGHSVKTYGLGYSYVGSQWTFTVDASQRNYENPTKYSIRLLLSPGLMVRADFLQLSLTDEITLNNRETSTSNVDDTHHELWFGVGVGDKAWHFAGYAKYVNDMALVGSLFF